jgi:hypothetical protein
MRKLTKESGIIAHEPREKKLSLLHSLDSALILCNEAAPATFKAFCTDQLSSTSDKRLNLPLQQRPYITVFRPSGIPNYAVTPAVDVLSNRDAIYIYL